MKHELSDKGEAQVNAILLRLETLVRLLKDLNVQVKINLNLKGDTDNA